jgi:hypothetical protein
VLTDVTGHAQATDSWVLGVYFTGNGHSNSRVMATRFTVKRPLISRNGQSFRGNRPP